MKRETGRLRRPARTLALALLAAALTGLFHQAQAQRRGLRVVRDPAPEIGPRVGYDFHYDDWSVGGQLRVPSRVLETLVSGDAYFSEATHPWQLNLDLVIRLGRFGSLYAGGGIGIFHAGTTDAGPDVLVGLHPPARGTARLVPYAEGRWTFLDGRTPFRLVFGINLVLRR